MAPIKKKCCVPYCKNIQDMCKKQFFKIGANLEGREQWLSSVGKAVAAKSQFLHCCEDHFDLPNDAENYIKFKYVPGTKLKLRTNVLPQKKLPLNVCRICLKLIYNTDDFVDISEKKGGKNAEIIATTLPELDLSLTVEPVACVKCFDPLEQYDRIKKNALRREVVVVNCIKSIVKRSPTRLIKNCEIDLFEEYNDIVELLDKERERSTVPDEPKVTQNQPEIREDKEGTDKSTEEIVIQIEKPNDDEFEQIEIKETDFKSAGLNALLEGEMDYRVVEDSQGQLAVVENMSHIESGNNPTISSKKTLQNIELLQNVPSSSVKRGDSIQCGLVDNLVELASENIYIHIGKKPLENVIMTPQL